MKLKYNAPVILTFAILSTIVLAIDTVSGGEFAKTFFTTYPEFDFKAPLSYLRLVSHVAGHANWPHLAGNFTLILLIGPLLEEKYSSKALLAMILMTAFTTSVFNGLFFNTGLLGASGVVFMLIILSSFTNLRDGEIPITLILVVGIFLTGEIVNAFKNDSISQFAHITGGLVGGGFGFLLSRDRQRAEVEAKENTPTE